MGLWEPQLSRDLLDQGSGIMGEGQGEVGSDCVVTGGKEDLKACMGSQPPPHCYETSSVTQGLIRKALLFSEAVAGISNESGMG